MTRDDPSPTFLSARHLPAGGPLLHDLEAHWRAVRGGRALPARSDLDPAALDAVLPWAFVAERVAPGVARLRVAGRKLTELLGMEARGMPLCAFFSPRGGGCCARSSNGCSTGRRSSGCLWSRPAGSPGPGLRGG